MRTTVLVAICTAGAVTILAGASAALAQAANRAPPASTANPGSTVRSLGAKQNLTNKECTELGGTLVNAGGICISGKACQVTDEKNIDHAVCISAK